MNMTLDWEGDLRFRAASSAGHQILLDGNADEGGSPMQALLAALGGCMSIDVVDILQKMRVPIDNLRVRVEGDRTDEPPRRFQKITMTFHIEGSVPLDKVERAIQLSFDKYCSVFHSLRPDLEVTHRVSVGPTPG